ncbi:MAG TPA: hypothetical protein VFO28_01010 [Burkholderiaceae bacterium]|nr:hypothetical protein [Burkholderiaceae bacterium]
MPDRTVVGSVPLQRVEQQAGGVAFSPRGRRPGPPLAQATMVPKNHQEICTVNASLIQQAGLKPE